MEADFIIAEAFETDLREFFQAMQCRNDKKKLRELLNTEKFTRLSEETERVIMVHLGWKQLTEKMEKEGLGMCPALKEMLEDEKAEGRKEGLKEAEIKRKEERVTIIKNMIREGMDYNMIRRITKCSSKEFSLAAKN